MLHANRAHLSERIRNLGGVLGYARERRMLSCTLWNAQAAARSSLPNQSRLWMRLPDEINLCASASASRSSFLASVTSMRFLPAASKPLLAVEKTCAASSHAVAAVRSAFNFCVYTETSKAFCFFEIFGAHLSEWSFERCRRRSRTMVLEGKRAGAPATIIGGGPRGRGPC